MMPRYEYSPYILPMLGSAGFLAMLAAYGWRHRRAAGAFPFAVLMSCAFFWAVGAAFEVAAVDLPTKIQWYKFLAMFRLPAATASLWFALEYANLSRWLTRRVLALLFLPSILGALLILTDDVHHLMALDWSLVTGLHPIPGPAGWVMIGYGWLLGVAAPLVFLWLFIESPLHRRPAALCLGAMVVTRVAYALDSANVHPIGPMDPTVLAYLLTAAMFALALFRFRMLNLVPVGRGTAIAQMREGMLILDADQRILDLNPAAERIIGVPASRARGRDVTDLLPAYSTEKSEFSAGEDGDMRRYVLRRSDLKDRHGRPLGSLILFGDVTEQRRAQAERVEEQSALATLRERDRVARELHDELGQVLGYVKMQAQSARRLAADGRASEADACLQQLVTVSQVAHDEVREFIVGARTATPGKRGFVSSLENHLRRFTETHGIATKLSVSPALVDVAFEPMTGVQLLRIIQESLTNVRKHAAARGVDIRLAARDGLVEVVVEDDGVGFDPALLEADTDQRFGLQVMRERAEEVGGTVKIHSAPSQGTRVVVHVPVRQGQ